MTDLDIRCNACNCVWTGRPRPSQFDDCPQCGKSDTLRLRGLLTLWLNYAPVHVRTIRPSSSASTLGEMTRRELPVYRFRTLRKNINLATAQEVCAREKAKRPDRDIRIVQLDGAAQWNAYRVLELWGPDADG